MSSTLSQSASSTDDPVAIDALGATGEYRTRNREVITDTAGVAVAELSIVPPLYVTRAISAQRKARPLPTAQREPALAKTAEIFMNSVIAGLDFDQYVDLASRVSGLPIAVTRAGARGVAGAVSTALEAVRPAQPAGAAFDWREERTRTGCAVWARRGEVFAVHASGNSPGIHGLWLQALALGYRVAIRPSRREPFTGHRLIHALRQAGFRNEDVVYLPTDYAGADEIIRAADLAMVYGGEDVVDKYAHDPSVFPNGPGRSKILITAEQDWRDYLEVIVDSISDMGGMACINTTAVLYEGDPARWHGPSPSGSRRSSSCPPPMNGPSCTPSRSTRHRPSRPISLPRPPAPPRCWVPIRWSPTSATDTRHCGPRYTYWRNPTLRSSTSNWPSPARGCLHGPAPMGSSRYDIHWCSTPSPATSICSTIWSTSRP